MNIFVHLLFLYIFLCALLMIIIKELKFELLYLKALLFVGVFLFEMVYYVLLYFSKKCDIEMGRITKSSLIISLVSVVGISIYPDLAIWNGFFSEKLGSPKSIYSLALIIVALVSFIYFIELIFTNNSSDTTECVNN
jgi:hypothetical protein